jgi:hypothetical protein
MTEKKVYKCWYDDVPEDEDPVEVTARSPANAAEQFVEHDWEGGAEWYLVKVRDGEDVSRWRVNIETVTEFTARRVKEES